MTTTRQEQDAKRRKDKPWRAWYSSPRWRGPAGRRTLQLRRIPWCEPCKVEGRSRPATIANHKIPHRGDPLLFWHGPLESTCKTCHDAMIQAAEHRGYRPGVDAEGWPIDPDHPFNRKARRAPALRS